MSLSCSSNCCARRLGPVVWEGVQGFSPGGLDHSHPIGMKFFSYKDELEQLLNVKVDLVSTEGLSRHVKPYVDKDKVLIYERTAA